jgi:hypothetical protein
VAFPRVVEVRRHRLFRRRPTDFSTRVLFVQSLPQIIPLEDPIGADSNQTAVDQLKRH